MGDDEKLIINLTRGNVLCERTVIADTPLPRMRGVLGKTSLPRGEGILLQPAPSIHTAFVRFAFDVVFLDGALQVIRVVERLKPWRAITVRHAVSALELAAGEISRRGVEVGDQIIVADPETESIAEGDSARDQTDAERAAAIAAQLADRDPESTRVLLVGADRRFRAVASALLTRRGYSVQVEDQAASIPAITARDEVDVVVLDSRSAPAIATLEAARLSALSPNVGFVLVSDGLAMTSPSMAIVQKWDSFDGLVDAIDAVHAARLPAGDAGP